jgi:hypothetical protein
MDEQTRQTNLRHLFGAAGRAHHAVYGGPNPGWARWYAEWMYGQSLPLLESDPSVDTVEAWLIRADERIRSEKPEGSWPGNYADWFIEWDGVLAQGRS